MEATITWRGLFEFWLLLLKLLFRFKFLTQFQSAIGNIWRITRNEVQDASSKKRLKTSDNDCQAPWSDLNHDVLFLIMMQLRIVDFPAFSGVCKAWRSFTLSNRTKFMASIPPISIYIFPNANGKDYYCYLRDLEGSFKTILPHFAGRTCVGYTCGYMVLFGRKTHDFWLVNPIIRHELHFHANFFLNSDNPERMRAFLIFSPLMSEWVFVMTDGSTNIWFSISGQVAWSHVSSNFPVVDLHAFKGKMYVINSAGHLCELRLNPKTKLMVLKTKNFLIFPKRQQFSSSHESLYVMRYLLEGSYEFHILDFEEMEWESCERTRESWPSNLGKCKCFIGNLVHDCLNDNLINK